MLRWLRWSLRLRRVEYRVAELPIFLIPILLTAPDAPFFLSAPFWEGLVIFLFLFAFGDLLNCLADRDLDALYKPHLTEAVLGLGVRGVVVQALLSALAALGLAAHLSWRLGRWQLLAAVVLGLGAGWAYSVEPVRLKGRGLWQLAFYWLGLFSGPMLFAAMLVQPWPELLVTFVCLGYGLMQTGVILVNTAEDYPEDRQMGVRTAVVALGLPRGMALAWVLTEVGALATLTACTALDLTRGKPIERLVALLPLAVASALVGAGLRRLQARVHRAGSDEAIAIVKRGARWVPGWITTLAVCSLLAALGVFL